MDNDLSHAANLRFENLDTRLRAVEDQLGITPPGEEGGDTEVEVPIADEPEVTPYTSRSRSKKTEGTE